MTFRNLQLQHLENRLVTLQPLQQAVQPQGWLKSLRQALGMSLEQLGQKMGASRQAALALEKREQTGAVTLNTLQQAAEAMDMKLVYAIVPKDGSLEALIERKSKELAEKIVTMASQNMALEGQENSPERLQKAIEERAREIREKNPGLIWD